MLTDEELFCKRCQLVLEDCRCEPVLEGISSHSLSVTSTPQNVNGDSGDSGVSPAGDDLSRANLPAVTAVTGSPAHRGRHSRPVTASGDSWPPGVTGHLPQKQISWTAPALLVENFPDPKWAVPGLFAEGLSLFAGPPKVGKSWLALGLGVAIASGGKALGSIDVERGSVLYLALEDTPRRLQRRLRQVLAGSPAPDGFDIAVECPPGIAGMGKLDEWLSRPRELPPRLVIIDVLERIRGPVPQGMSVYSADYQAVSMIKAIADLHGVSIIVLTHVRKGSADDFLSEVSGTLGLSGAADTICVLKRARGDISGTLQVTGRDVDEETYALSFAPDLGLWQLMGLESEHGLAENRRKILAYLRMHDGSKPAEIAIGTGLGRDLVKHTCNRMATDGQLDSDGNGKYFAPPPKEI